MIYRFLILLLLFSATAAFSQNNTVNWVTLQEAEAKMAKEPRKVLVDVYTTWCGPCRMMDQNTFQNPKVVEYINKNYYAVKINAESPDPIEFKGTTYKNDGFDPNKSGRNSTHEIAAAIAPVNGRIAYPTVVYMDENFKILAPVQGYHTPQQIEPILRYIAEEDYSNVSFEDYKAKFSPQFK
jgi:thioredoxin-related protein